MTLSRRSISDYQSAGLPEGEGKKSSDRERFAVHDLRAAVARATLIQRTRDRWVWEPVTLHGTLCGRRKSVAQLPTCFSTMTTMSRMSFNTPRRGSEGPEGCWGTMEPQWSSLNHTEAIKRWNATKFIKLKKWKYARWIWAWKSSYRSNKSLTSKHTCSFTFFLFVQLVMMITSLGSWKVKKKYTRLLNFQITFEVLYMMPGWNLAESYRHCSSATRGRSTSIRLSVCWCSYC